MSEHDLELTFTDTEDLEAEVRELLEGAGRRPSVPEEELAGVRAVARERWLAMVNAERDHSRFGRRTTVLALAASLLLAVALGWWLMPEWNGPPTETVATVELVRGHLTSGDAGAAPGSPLAAGSVLETGRGSSGAALRLLGAQSVRLDADTRVRLVSNARFELERGAVYVDTHDAAGGRAIEVETAFGVVRDIGTQFLIRLGEGGSEQLTVQVREGEVVFEAPEVRRAARAGQGLIVRRGSREIETVGIDLHGDAWDWIETVTPAMDIEGAPLSAYLEWVSRETGRELRYETPGLAEVAESIELSGSIAGLTPEQSLEILPGSGLGHRIENGWLLVEQPPAPARE